MLIDSHAHLDFPPLYGDLNNVLNRAEKAGVRYILSVGLLSAESQTIEKTLKIARENKNIFYSVGIHPHDAKDGDTKLINYLESSLKNDNPIAVGETGLDYHYDNSPREMQRKIFRYQIELAIELDLPLIIHTREALDDTISILNEYKTAKLSGVFHCFTGDLKEAQRLLDFKGFCLSIPGVVTFPKAEKLRKALEDIPQNRTLIETDCPYLAPLPHRGKTNEPAFVAHIAEKVAEIWGVTPHDVGRITSRNFARLFGVGPEEPPAIAYSIRNSLYLNITNNCTLACKFCGKRSDYVVKGHYLKLPEEPSVEEIWRAVSDADSYDEIVFCGYGEPTIRLEVLKEVARRIKGRHPKMKVRVNTDGLMNLREGRDATAELKGLVDTFSVSLNASDGKSYAAICPSKYGERAYEEVKRFIATARNGGFDVQATAVNLPDLDVEKVRAVAERELKVKFRVRKYNNIGS
ncbi:MAG: YchF/TatD family DNA exonuclease [Myxococcota bacterium]